MMRNIILISMLSFLTLGCVSIPDGAPEVKVVQPKKVLIQAINLKEVDGQWVVSGKVKLRSRTTIKPRSGSHIDYTITANTGELIEEGAIKLSRKVRYQTNPSSLSKFQIRLPSNTPSNSLITIGFHPIEPKFQKREVSHIKNILI